MSVSQDLYKWTAHWRPWQWGVVLLLCLGIAISGAFALSRLWHLGPTPVQLSPLEQQIEDTQRALARTPQRYDIQAQLAELYVQQARLTGESAWYLLAEQNARKSLQRAKEINGAAYLALARSALARHHFDSAEVYLKRAERDVGFLSDVLSLRFDLHLARGDLEAAAQLLQRFEAALNKPLYWRNGPRLASIGETEREMIRGHVFARQGLLAQQQSQLQQAQNLYQRAEQALERADLHSRVWLKHLRLTLALRQGDSERAQTLLREIRQWAPNYLPARLSELELLAQNQHWPALLSASQELLETHELSIVWLYAARARQAMNQSADEEIAQGLAPFETAQSTDTGHRRDQVRLLLLRQAPGDLEWANQVIQEELQIRQDRETLQLALEISLLRGQASALPPTEAADYLRALSKFGAHPETQRLQGLLQNVVQSQHQTKEKTS